MNRIATFYALTIVLSAGLSPLALAQHLDVMPVSVAGDPARIETGSFDFAAFQVGELPPLRAYENDLDEPAPGLDLLAGEAGFAALSATAAANLLGGSGFANLPGGVNPRFDFRAFPLGGQPAANLWYWDGIDDDGDGDYAEDIAFTPAASVQLAYERDGGLFSAAVNGSSGDVAGFVIGTTLLDNPGTADDETGFLHVDLDALLDDADNDPGTAVPLGIYAVSAALSHDGGASADPIFWVFNAGLGEEGEPAAEAALEYVPEPASALLLVIAAAALMRRHG